MFYGIGFEWSHAPGYLHSREMPGEGEVGRRERGGAEELEAMLRY